jgi:hypothetical protein
MVETLKVLAQFAPAPGSMQDFYTVPPATSTAVSSIVICNQNGTDISFRISIAVAGEPDDSKQYIYYDLPMLANDTFTATIGITLGQNDVIRVQTDTAGVSFSLFGDEVS